MNFQKINSQNRLYNMGRNDKNNCSFLRQLVWKGDQCPTQF